MVGGPGWKKMKKGKEDLHFDEENKKAIEAFLAKRAQGQLLSEANSEKEARELADQQHQLPRGWFSSVIRGLLGRSS